MQSATCDKCRRKSPIKHVWVVSELTGKPRELVHRFKFERTQVAAAVIADFMSESLPYMPEVLLIPIPPATSRLRQRGYDHTKLITKELSRKMGVPWTSSLARLGQTRQVGTKRQQRLVQLEGAFRAVSAAKISGKHVMLVDDVVTTGATLNEAARVIKKSGAKSVDAVVFAQK